VSAGNAQGCGGLSASAHAVRLLPYGFARDNRILVAHQRADSIEVWISEPTLREDIDRWLATRITSQAEAVRSTGKQ